MADQQPSWLGKEGDAAPTSEPAATPAVEETQPDIAVSDEPAAAAAASTVDESDLSKMILFMRIANMGLAIAMLTCSVSLFIINGECPPQRYRTFRSELDRHFCRPPFICFDVHTETPCPPLT